jgi:hypothetical protein
VVVAASSSSSGQMSRLHWFEAEGRQSHLPHVGGVVLFEVMWW